MSEAVDLSTPCNVSGCFLRLDREGQLAQARTLWREFVDIKTLLNLTQRDLRSCNEPSWLFAFSASCKRKRQNFSDELRRHVAALEDQKAKTQGLLDLCTEEIRLCSPSLLETAQTMSAPISQLEFAPTTGSVDGPVVAPRNAVIRRCLKLSALDTCRRLDLYVVPIPSQWKHSFPNIDSWVQAYREPLCRKRLHKLISTSKKSYRLPDLPPPA